MKKKPAKEYEKQTGRKPFIASMACESLFRKTSWKEYGCNAFENKRPTSTPMAFGTEQDVLHYLVRYKVPYCSVYGEIKPVPKKKKNQVDGQLSIDEINADDYADDVMLETTGCDRTGCIFCVFGCHLDKGESKFEKLKKTHPRQYDYCINGGEFVDGVWQPNEKGLGLAKVLDFIGIKY